MILRGLSDTNSIKLTRKTIQRLSVSVRVEQTVPGVMVGTKLGDVNLKCELRRNGVTHVVFHENMSTLCAESMFFHGNECILEKTAYMQVTASQQLQPLMIDLGSPINLQGNDELFFEASMTASWLSAGGANANGCTIEFEWREFIGVERAVPLIQTKVVQAGITRVNESLGDNVTSIGLISNSFNSAFNEANRIFEAVIITSDRWNVNDNFDRMISRRLTQFETIATANSRLNSWVYRPETEIDNCQLSVSMLGPNVIVSNNHIVWRSFIADQFTIARSINMDEKHETRNHRKFFGRRTSEMSGASGTAQ